MHKLRFNVKNFKFAVTRISYASVSLKFGVSQKKKNNANKIKIIIMAINNLKCEKIVLDKYKISCGKCGCACVLGMYTRQENYSSFAK